MEIESLPQALYRDFLVHEGYQLREDGTLSFDDFTALSSRLDDPSFNPPDGFYQSDLYQFLFDNDYESYVDEYSTKYQSTPTASSATKGQSGVVSRAGPAVSKVPGVKVEASIESYPLTDSLIDEIANDTQGIERHLLAYLCEEEARLLFAVGQNDEAALLLEQLSVLYQELGDADNKNFALARASICYGDFSEAATSLKVISSSSPLAKSLEKLLPSVVSMQRKKEQVEKVMPAISALEQMRLRALEQLEFDGSQIQDTWYKTESFTADQKERKQRLIGKVNKGINEMIQALVEGRVHTIEEAFDQFESYTSLRTIPDHTPWKGNVFRQTLLEGAGDVDVEQLMSWSHLTDQTAREKALLQYTIDLRDSPKMSLRGYPANTILINLEALKNSKDPETRKQAEALYRNATGEEALTGLSDAVYAGLLREGAQSAVPMVLAMMVAGPVGAYAEGTVAAAEITSAGRVVWTGANAAGKAGWIARGAGLAAEAPVFWAGNDAIHAVLLGGGDYFTGHGLASSFLMLGGLRLFGAAWQSTGGAYLGAAAKALPELSIPLAVGNQAGALGTEWAGFWGLGQFEQWIGLVPAQDTTLRQEIFEAGITLLQLKVAVAAGNMVTGDMMKVLILEAKLDSAKKRLQQNFDAGQMAFEDFQTAAQEITQLEIALAKIQNPALAEKLTATKQAEQRGEAQRVVDYNAKRSQPANSPDGAAGEDVLFAVGTDSRASSGEQVIGGKSGDPDGPDESIYAGQWNESIGMTKAEFDAEKARRAAAKVPETSPWYRKIQDRFRDARGSVELLGTAARLGSTVALTTLQEMAKRADDVGRRARKELQACHLAKKPGRVEDPRATEHYNPVRTLAEQNIYTASTAFGTLTDNIRIAIAEKRSRGDASPVTLLVIGAGSGVAETELKRIFGDHLIVDTISREEVDAENTAAFRNRVVGDIATEGVSGHYDRIISVMGLCWANANDQPAIVQKIVDALNPGGQAMFHISQGWNKVPLEQTGSGYSLTRISGFLPIHRYASPKAGQIVDLDQQGLTYSASNFGGDFTAVFVGKDDSGQSVDMAAAFDSSPDVPLHEILSKQWSQLPNRRFIIRWSLSEPPFEYDFPVDLERYAGLSYMQKPADPRMEELLNTIRQRVITRLAETRDNFSEMREVEINSYIRHVIGELCQGVPLDVALNDIRLHQRRDIFIPAANTIEAEMLERRLAASLEGHHRQGAVSITDFITIGERYYIGDLKYLEFTGEILRTDEASTTFGALVFEGDGSSRPVQVTLLTHRQGVAEATAIASLHLLRARQVQESLPPDFPNRNLLQMDDGNLGLITPRGFVLPETSLLPTGPGDEASYRHIVDENALSQALDEEAWQPLTSYDDVTPYVESILFVLESVTSVKDLETAIAMYSDVICWQDDAATRALNDARMLTTDEGRKAHKEAMDGVSALFENDALKIEEKIRTSPYYPELSRKKYATLLRKLEKVPPPPLDRALNDQIKPIVSAYESNITFSVTIGDRVMTRKGAVALLQSEDRQVRETAWRALTEGYVATRKKLEADIAKVIEVRTAMANKAGFKTAADFIHARQGRSREEAVTLDASVKQTFAPLMRDILQRRGAALGLDAGEFKPWDVQALPPGTDDIHPYTSDVELLDKMQAAAARVNPEMATLLGTLRAKNLIDVSSRTDKFDRPYTVTFEQTKLLAVSVLPDGSVTTVRDVAHELGHALHFMKSFDQPLFFDRAAASTMEPGNQRVLSETASMSNELLIGAQTDLLYEDARVGFQAFRLQLEFAIETLCRSSMYDEFEQWIYSDPAALDPRVRDEKYFQLMKDYGLIPVDANWAEYADGLSAGQMGISNFITKPLTYMSNYGLTQTAAFQVYRRYLENPTATIHDFNEALRAGNSVSIEEMWEMMGIKYDFSVETLSELASFMREQVMQEYSPKAGKVSAGNPPDKTAVVAKNPADVRVDFVNPDYFTAYHNQLTADELEALMIHARDQQETLHYAEEPWEFPPEQTAFLERAIPEVLERRVAEARGEGATVVHLTIKSIGIGYVADSSGPGELPKLLEKVFDAIAALKAPDLHFNITVAGFDVNLANLEGNKRQIEKEARIFTRAHQPEGQVSVEVDLNYGDLTDPTSREVIAGYGPSDFTVWRYTWIASDPEILDPELRPAYTSPLLNREDAHRFVDALRGGTSGALLVAEIFGTEKIEIMEVEP